MARPTTPFRLALFVFALMASSVITSATTAYAQQQSCGDDIKRLSTKREAELNRVNNVVKAAKGKALDPAVFCAQSAGFNAADSAFIAYMEKNKDWCGVPDEVIAGLKANHVKSLAFSTKACTIAAQAKKREAAGLNGAGAPQAPALPAGPL